MKSILTWTSYNPDSGGKLLHMINRKRFNKKWQDSFFVYGVLAWPLIHFMVFWVGMNAKMFYTSFFVEKLSGSLDFVGFENYKNVLAYLTGMDQGGIINTNVLLNCVSLIVLALLINMPITILFSYAIYKKIHGHRFFRISLFIPAIISVSVLCLIFKLSIDINVGIVNQVIRFFGMGGNGIDSFGIIPASGWLGNDDIVWKVILVFSVWTGISGNLIYFCSAISRIPSSVIESAQLDGASDIKQFFSIVMPMIWPIITTLSITLISGVIAWFMPSLLLVGATNTRTSTFALIITTMTKNGTAGGIIPALGVIIAIVGAITILTFKKLMEKVFVEVEY